MRDAEIKRLYNEAEMSTTDIGRLYSLSRQRVHQIVNEGLPPKPKAVAKVTNDKPALTIKQRDALMRRHYWSGKRTATSLAEEFGISRGRVSQIVQASPREQKWSKPGVGVRKSHIKVKTAEAIKSAYIEGDIPIPKIAEKFGISPSTVRRVARGQTTNFS